MRRIRVGIIGTGFGAQIHAPMFHLHPGYELRCLASVHRGIDNLSLNYLKDVARYDDWLDMIQKEELDLLSIVSLPAYHCDMTLAAARAGLNILCEKPMAMNSYETLRMVQEIKKSGTCGYVNFLWRLLPVRLKIKQIIQKGKLGRIQHIKYYGSFSGFRQLNQNYRGWEGKREFGGGFLFAVGSHMLDSLMWWSGERIAEVYADLKTLIPYFHGSDGPEERNSDDAFTIMGKFENGATFNVDFMGPAVEGMGWQLEIYGTRGTLVMKNDKTLEMSTGEGFKGISLDSSEPPEQLDVPARLYYNGFYPMIDRLYHSIVHHKSDAYLPVFEDGHNVQAVMDAMMISSEKQTGIRVNYDVR